MKKSSFLCLTLLALCFLASCGKKGGNANVYSSTVTVRSSDWYWDDTSWRVDLDYDAINLNVHNNGAVLVYMNNQNTWRQVPLTFYYSVIEGNQTLYCSSSIEVSSYQNGVSIFWTENDFYNGFRPEDHDFKIVAISSIDYASRPDVDYSDYESVKVAFNLDE